MLVAAMAAGRAMPLVLVLFIAAAHAALGRSAWHLALKSLSHALFRLLRYTC
jgi:hypothetical protein